MKAILYSQTEARPFDSRRGLDRLDDNYFPRVENIDPVDDTPVYSIRGDLRRLTVGLYNSVPFSWFSHDGDQHNVANMAASHLFYALRLVWNHSVPEIWRVGDYKRYPDVPYWPESYRRRAIFELTKELATRDSELSESIRRQFAELVLKTGTICILGI